MRILTLFLIATCPIFTFAQSAEQTVRKVADKLIENTSFRFVNKKSGETFSSTKNIPYSENLVVESPENEWYYVNGVINIAMMQLADFTGEKKYSDYSLHNLDFIFSNLDYFKKKYDEKISGSSFEQYFRLGKLDDCGAMGAGLADINRLAKKKEYSEYLKKATKYITTKQQRLSDRTFVRPEPHRMTIWADDLYMSVPFLSRMGRLTGNNKFFDDAIKQVYNFTKYLYNKNTGLFYHCWYSDVQLNGVAHWGRCNGWVMMAQVELLSNLPPKHPKRNALIKLLVQQITGVSRYQAASGLWHQVLDKPDSYQETSSTAMFTYSIAKAVNEGWIDKSYFTIAENGWKGVLINTRPDGQVQNICVGTGIEDNIRFYYERPVELNDLHGIGAVLLAGVEMSKAEKRK